MANSILNPLLRNKVSDSLKLKMSSYLLKILNVFDEPLFDSLCQNVILKKGSSYFGQHKIDESHLEILRAYFGAVMDSS